MSLQDLFETYHDQVQFIKVYIREAHPVDGWWLGQGLMGLILHLSGSRASRNLHDPPTIKDRRAAARECVQTLGLDVPTYVDDLQDSVNKTYAAWPTRLYLIGTDGCVMYAGGPGPFGFSPSELKMAIEKILQASS